MTTNPTTPIFFISDENLGVEERADQKRREKAEIIRWKHRFHKLDAIKPGETAEAFQIRCLNKRLVHLEREKAQKELQLKISNAPVHRREAGVFRGCILRLLDGAVRYDQQIEAAKIDLNELRSQINRANIELAHAVTAVPSDYVYTAALDKSRKQVAAMESRLHNSRTLEGKLHAENRRQRDIINNMLVARKQYNQQWIKYVQRLNRNRKFLLDMIERATLAFNQGEDLCYRIDSLKTQENHDKRARVQEMIEVERHICDTRHVNEFLRTKGFPRHVAGLDPRLISKRDRLKRIHRNDIERFGAIIGSTKNCLQFDEIEDVLSEIEKQQDKYMAIFKYMSVTNAKIEQANEIARDLEKDSERLHEGERHQRLFNERNINYKLQQLQTSQKITVKLRDDINMQAEALEQKLGIIEQVLLLFGFDKLQIEQLLSSENQRSRLTEENLIKLLAIIERKVLDLIDLSNLAMEEDEEFSIDELYGSQQCAECAEGQDVNQHDERIVLPIDHRQLVENVQKRQTAPEMQYRLHTLSHCKLPRSRMLVNKRYQ